MLKESIHNDYLALQNMAIGYGHRQEGYWQRDNALEKEAWAQCGRIVYARNSEVLELINELFPNTTRLVNEILKEVVK